MFGNCFHMRVNGHFFGFMDANVKGFGKVGYLGMNLNTDY